MQGKKVNVTLFTSSFVEIFVSVFFVQKKKKKKNHTFLIDLATNKLTFTAILKGVSHFMSLLFKLNS